MKFNVSQQMKDIFTDYTDEVKELVTEVLEEVGHEAASELKGAGSFKGKKYRSSWDTKVESSRTFDSVIVHNKKHYRLSHLLEFGHATRNGGRTRAFPHIAPVNEKAVRNAEKKIAKAITSLK